MAKKSSKKVNKQKQNKQVSVFEKGDVTFRFDDESLQDAYLDALKKYDILELNLPKVKVSYVDAKSITQGKDKDRLDEWLERYEQNDNDYLRGSKHKDGMFDKIIDSTSSNHFRYQIKKLDKYWTLVQKANNKWGTTTKDGHKVNRYNVVWYTNAGEGSHSPV